MRSADCLLVKGWVGTGLQA